MGIDPDASVLALTCCWGICGLVWIGVVLMGDDDDEVELEP